MNGAIDMYFYEQSLLMKWKQEEFEASAKHAWKFNKNLNQTIRKQSCCDNTITVTAPQVCCLF